MTKYERICDRTEPITLYAGKALRFIETFIECDEDGNEELLRACFIRHQFDEQGLWNKDEKERVMRGAREGVSVVGKGDYMEELTKPSIDPSRWTPTPEMVQRFSTKELGIRIRADKVSTAPVWSVLATVALFQGVSLERDSKIRLIGVETWTIDVLRTLYPDDIDSIRSDVRAQLSLFVEDYQEVNGKQKH